MSRLSFVNDTLEIQRKKKFLGVDLAKPHKGNSYLVGQMVYMDSDGRLLTIDSKKMPSNIKGIDTSVLPANVIGVVLDTSTKSNEVIVQILPNKHVNDGDTMIMGNSIVRLNLNQHNKKINERNNR